jgi:hypothetical protein
MKIELHRLQIGDSDDPEIIAGFALGDWTATEKGQFCKQHFQDLTYLVRPNMNTLGFDVIVYGEIDASPALTEYHLRWL